jgi:hypothetical protein
VSESARTRDSLVCVKYGRMLRPARNEFEFTDARFENGSDMVFDPIHTAYTDEV